MAKRAKKKVKSVYPVYIFAAVLLVMCVIMRLPGITNYLIAFGVAALAYYLFRTYVFKDKFVDAPAALDKTGDKAADEAIEVGRKFIAAMRKATGDIDEHIFRTGVYDIISDSEGIFEFVSKHPEAHKSIKNFTEYYIPQTQKLVETYIELKGVDSSRKDMVDTLRKIEQAVPGMVEAFDAQHDNLYNDKAFDIRTDIKVLENVLKSDGLGGGK